MEHSHAKGAGGFDTTHWSLVMTAQSDEESQTSARKALETLCCAYWYPLYAFVRHRGHSPADAQDLTQSFLAKFIETGGFASADRERGRFRTFLLSAMKHFLINEWHRARAAKRGSGMTLLEWDALEPEAKYALEPIKSEDPDLNYDRDWAVELMNRAKNKLHDEAEANGKLKLFEALKGSLTGEEPPRHEIATRMAMSEGSIKAAVHRLRQRYRSLLRCEIAETVATRGEIDEEMRHLVSVLRSNQFFS
ncbi:MAG: sigma-70 family RNA polymerase sigma factor [Verrucomicrobia bacterium]|jgi:RNA polymerase sigma factor (sigma-70 family)|nr:sigma-70 family RNA polymerase sigma factor [Verrucomicrobiota bacterium]MDG1857322.1 sigma factor [Verrucomicrobiota bacterium]|tara:strand:+ start:86 stop:835 length:750 start_codon:yes stop_codon:yes gene_type:complete